MLSYLAALHRQVLIFDGAMGTTIQQRRLTADDFGGTRLDGCNDHLVLTRPDVIREIHDSFLAAGSDVIETNSFQASPRRLAEWGLREQAREINVAAARIAREAAAGYATADRPIFVAGAMGPTGMLPSSNDPALSAITFGELTNEYYEQAKYLVEGGVDLLLFETMQDMLELKAAIAGAQRLFAELGHRIPVQAQFTLDTSGRMLLGTDVASAVTTIGALGVDVIGLNCSTGPEYMREPVRLLSGLGALPIAVIPNAGLPINSGGGEAVYPLQPEPMAAMLAEFVREFGVRAVGGCCGTTPAHIRALVAAVRALGDSGQAIHRQPQQREPRVSSAMRAITLRQDPAPLLIGERLNAQGSRKVKRLLLAEDYDALVDVAREQIESGAHVLDVCVAVTERADEAEQMARLVRQLSMTVEAPLAIDSTEPAVIERALEHIPGRALINSINMGSGRARIDAVVPLAKKHGAVLIALTIDEIGMARTRDRKLDVARKIHDIVVHEYGLPPDALIFDALTFTLATGDAEWIDSAAETIEGIRLIKQQLPGVFTTLGVSNVSFGLAPEARAVLNSVFLYHCVQAGLDAAIVNAAHVKPYAEIALVERELADDLVFNRAPDALQKFIAHFQSASADPDAARHDPTEGMSADAKVHWMVVHRKKDGIEAALDEAGVRQQPVRLLNEVLLPAMKEVGDRFGAGELILPFVLQSAEVMKKAVMHLEQFLERAEGHTKGKIVLATVYGDVHDIGKSLVSTILSNNGYTVFDLGKQVPVSTLIDRAIEVGADAIGLSALLVSTSKQMTLCVQELARREVNIPVLIGGAAINRRFGRRAMLLDGERPYGAGVFYCKDAFEGLDTVEALQDSSRREDLLRQAMEEATTDEFLHAAMGTSAPVDPHVRSNVRRDAPIPRPAFFGVRVEHHIPLDEVLALVDRKELFRLQWGARGSGGQWDAAVAEFEPVLARLTADAFADGWLQPASAYGIFPAQSSGTELVVYDPAAFESDGSLREVGRFGFPRQDREPRLCLADYFRSQDGSGGGVQGHVDVVALQVVTVGEAATRQFEKLQAAGLYTEAYYSHGLAVQAAEAAAEWMHRKIRAALGIPAGQGKRYSWGYPACPDLAYHATLFKLLPAETALGLSLTAAFQLVPEQSTAAIIVHHPDAKYFIVRPGVTDARPV